jgi:MFS family permease
VETLVSEQPSVPPPQRLNLVLWLIIIIAAIGFAYDVYALLMMPLIARPALSELLNVDPNTDSGNRDILNWTAYIMWGSAICGGTFGLLGGYMADLFGRRRVLTWSILLYAGSALASGFSTSATMLLILRCTTFIGVCVEFVAATAWLAELFPNPRQRETILGWTQACSSFGGILVTATYYVILQLIAARMLPPIFGETAVAWRWTLISGIIPVLPLLVIRPFLPESPAWAARRAAGTLRRPSLLELFAPGLLRTSLVTAILVACAYACAFGAIQMTPQIVPGLDPDLPKLVGFRMGYEASASPENLEKFGKEIEKLKGAVEKTEQANSEDPALKAMKGRLEGLTKAYGRAKGILADDPEGTKRQKWKEEIEDLQSKQEKLVATVQGTQETGGLVGRIALAILALLIVSRRRLLWVFLVPAMLLIPLVYAIPGAGNLSADRNVTVLQIGMFVVGFFTVSQFSFWGNYLPRVYPVHLRGTGESFAANVGGRMFGTAGNALNGMLLAPWLLASIPALSRSASIAYAAAIIAFGVFFLGFIVSFWLPEPKEEAVEHPEPKVGVAEE